ncbi:MAG: hypothetical protein AB8B85_03285 [Paracoccaceae bacterium]
MRLILATLLIVVLTLRGIAMAEGFKIDDLQGLDVDTSGYVGGETFSAGSKEPERLTVFCLDGCEDMVAIDILLGRSEDGTEGRYRSGETTIEQMEGLCKANNPTCELDAAKIGNAVGWVTRYDLGTRAGSTTVLFRDGDQLIIRSLAPDLETAAANGRRALETIGRRIVEGE